MARLWQRQDGTSAFRRETSNPRTCLFRLLWHVSRRQGGAFAEKEVFHVLGDEVLRFLLPGHQAVLVEDHLHAILPELPRLGRDILVDPLTELARPRRRVQAG